VSERDTNREKPAEPDDGRDIPRGTDEHADSETTRRERSGATKAAPQEQPDQDRGRATRDR
jgi:hypothetical protein